MKLDISWTPPSAQLEPKLREAARSGLGGWGPGRGAVKQEALDCIAAAHVSTRGVIPSLALDAVLCLCPRSPRTVWRATCRASRGCRGTVVPHLWMESVVFCHV